MTAYPELNLMIGGESLDAKGRDTLAVVNPATAETIGELPCASDADLDLALNSAQSAFLRWQRTSAAERGGILRKAAQLMRERQEVAARIMTLEQGKPLPEARLELNAAADILDWSATEGMRAYGRILPPRLPDTRQMVLKEPLGVVAAFAPWNFPAATPMRKIAGSLAAGCCCILKPSEETPATALLMAQALADAGLPAGALNVVFGAPARISIRLISNPIVRKVSFTGSTRVGKVLLGLAAQNVVRATMELGGHAPFIVFDDVDAGAIGRQAAASKFRNAGQICTAPTRFIVHEDAHNAFLHGFTEVAQGLKVGPGDAAGVTMGPLIGERRVEFMEHLVRDALAGGAKLSAGGDRLGREGFFFGPTVLSDLAPDALCLREEPFGPLAAIVPFRRDEEAIALANALPFGLAAYAFTNDANRIIKLGDGIEAGMLGLNTFFITVPELPFGGVKDLGYGSEGGIEGLESYLQTKFVAQGQAIVRPAR